MNMNRHASWVWALASVVVGCGSAAEAGANPDGVTSHETFDAGKEGTGVSTHGQDAGKQSGPVPSFAPVRIACGQTSAVTDADGNTWSKDEDYAGGTALFNAEEDIANTSTPSVYWGQRHGVASGGTVAPFHYTVTAPPGRIGNLWRIEARSRMPPHRAETRACKGRKASKAARNRCPERERL
jgi:hypothetical protein